MILSNEGHLEWYTVDSRYNGKNKTKGFTLSLWSDGIGIKITSVVVNRLIGGISEETPEIKSFYVGDV